MNHREKVVKKATLLLFVIYIFVLFLVLIFKCPTEMTDQTIKNLIAAREVTRLEPQLEPFQTIIDYVKKAHTFNDWFVKNLVGNVVIFLPYGFLISWFSKWNAWKVILSGCGVSVFIEVLQYITALGLMDIDDVILNIFGVTIGYVLYVGFKHLGKK